MERRGNQWNNSTAFGKCQLRRIEFCQEIRWRIWHGIKLAYKFSHIFGCLLVSETELKEPLSSRGAVELILEVEETLLFVQFFVDE